MAKNGGRIDYTIGLNVDKSSVDRLRASLQEIQKITAKDLKINLGGNIAEELIQIRQEAANVEQALERAYNPKLGTYNIEAFNNALTNTYKTSLSQVYTQFSKIGDKGEATFKQLTSSLLQTNIQLKESHSLLDKMAQTLGNTIKWTIASTAVNSFTNSIQQAWGYTKALDSSLNDIRIVTSKSADEMANFAIQANNAAKELGATTTDYTNAALIYAQQGLSDEEVEARARITLKTANVTGQSTEEVSQQLTAVWNGYKVGAEGVEEAVDKLAAVAANSASNLQELSVGMSKVASAAEAMGVSEDQLAAQLSTIISVTRQAPESVGTALRTVYARISDIKAGLDEDGVTLGRYSGKMAELGFNVLDVNGDLRDMGEVIEEIGSKWSSLTKEQQVSLAQTMAGQRQYNNLLALFNNFEKYNKMLNVAQTSMGTLQEQQDIYEQRTSTHLRKLKASMEDIYDSVIDQDALNTINDLIDALAKVADLGADLIDAIGGGTTLLTAFGSTATLVFSKQLAKGLETSISNFNKQKENVATVKKLYEEIGKIETTENLKDDQVAFLDKRAKALKAVESGMMDAQGLKVFEEQLNTIANAEKEAADQQEKFIQGISEAKKAFEESGYSIEGNFEDWIKDFSNVEKYKDWLDERSNIPIADFNKVKDSLYVKNEKGENLRMKRGADTGSLDEEKKIFFSNLKEQTDEQVKSLQKLKTEYPRVWDQLSEESKKNVGKIISLWDSFDKEMEGKTSESKVKAYNDLLQEMAEIDLSEVQSTIVSVSEEIDNANEKLGNIITAANKLADDTELATKRATDEATGTMQQVDETLESLDRAADIQKYIEIASGFGQIASALQSVQSVGSIIADDDIEGFERFKQIATSLVATIALLATGIYTVSNALGVMNFAMGKEATDAFAATAANAAHSGSILGVKWAADGATLSLSAFNVALEVTPAGLAITAIGAIAAALIGVTSYYEAANEEAIEFNNTIIEEQNKILENIDKNYELINSLELLNQEKKATIGNIETIIEKFGLEEDAANKLRNSYGDLTQYIKNYRAEQAGIAKDASDKAFNAAFDNVKRAAKGGIFENVFSNLTSRGVAGEELATGKIDFTIGGDFWYNAVEDAFASKFSDIEGVSNLEDIFGQYLSLKTEMDPNSIAELYHQIDERMSSANEEERGTRLYKNLEKFLERLRDSVEEYEDTKQERAIKTRDEISSEFEKNGGISPEKIQSLDDYRQAIETLNEELTKHTQDTEDALFGEDPTKLAKDYFTEWHAGLTEIYGNAFDLSERLREKFGTDSNVLERVEDKLGDLDDTAITWLQYINLDNLSSWEQFENIIKYLENVDLSNLLIVTDPFSMLQFATEEYNLYDSLEDQIKSSKKKTISKKEYENLGEEAQKYFTLTANGQYKMTGDAQEFYETINNLKLNGFKKNIEALEVSTNRLNTLKGLNYDELKGNGYSFTAQGSLDFASRKNVRNQLDYLLETQTTDETKLATWESMFENNNWTDEALKDLAKALEEAGDQTDKLNTRLKENENILLANHVAIGQSADSFRELKQLLDEGTISEKAYNTAAIELDEQLDTQDLDLDEWEKYSEYLQDIADESEMLDDALDDNDDSAKVVAKTIMKMNTAIDTLADNWEDWLTVLKTSSKESKEYYNAISQAKDAVADLLDTNVEYIDNDFITDHFDEITQAATGSETAIDSLKDAFSQKIVAEIIVDNKLDEANITSQFEQLQTYLDSLDLKAGAEIDVETNEDLVTKLQDFVNMCGMTADQANAFFDSIGYEPVFKTEYIPTVQENPIVYTTEEVVDEGDYNAESTAFSAIRHFKTTKQYSWTDGYTKQSGLMPVVALGDKDHPPEISGFTVKPTGVANNYSSANAGGGSPGNSSGKSGSGSSSKPSQKDHEKPIEDDRDIYHDINIEIEQAKRNLERVQKIQERLFGKDLINNLNKQIALIDKQKEKLLEKQKIQEWDLANQQKELGLLGVTFDEYNNIANYMQILAEGQQKVNDATAEYNNLVDAYNAKGTKDEQEGLEASLDAAKEKLQNATDAYKKLEDKIKNYDQLTVDMADLVDELTEATQQQIEIKITKFRMNVQIRLDMGEAQRDWNNFKRNVLYKTDILKDTNFDKIFKDAIKDLQDAISYFNVNGSVGSLQTLTDQIVRTRKEIEDIDKTGTSAIYGDNKAKAMEDLQNDLKELMSQMENIEELINSIDQAYLDTMEDISDQFNKQIEDYEFINELLQHDMNLLTLLYGEKNFDAMNNYYTQLEANNLKQLDSLKQQAEFWKERWLAAGDDIQAAAMFEEKYKETIKNLNSLIEESAKTLQDKYTNAITGIFDALDKKISDGKGTDYLSTEWDLINKHADEYLDTINTAFAIQETESKYNKAINDAQSVKNQQALKKLQNEQLEILKNKEKVTQYDVDRAEKLLQIEQARIALEEAQNAKTSMRLKRDSQGNYSYEYVADDNDIAEAQDALNSAMNDLYNFDKAAYKANLNELLGAWKEFETELAAVLTDSALSEEERTEKVALIKEKYGERINFLTEDNLNIRQNLTESAFADLAQLYETDVESYKSMTAAEQDELLHNIIPIWQSGIGAMADEITKEGGFEATCKDAFKEIENAASEYSDSLKIMAEAAGANFDNVKQGIDPLATELEKLITPTNELMNKVGEQEEKIKSLRLEVEGLRDDWGEVYEAAKKAVSETNEYILAQQEQAAQEAQAAQSGTGNNSGAGSANGVGTGSGAGSTGSGTSGVGTGSGAGVSAAAASAELIDGIVGNIMQGENTWGWGNERIANITSKFGREVAEAVQGKINREWPNVSLLHGYDPEFYKRYSMSNFRSGGYTGDWAGREGRLALLHQKELVLNQQDTSNLLNAVETLRTVMSSMNGTFAARANDIRNGLGNLFTNNEAIEQNVHIDASFPNVNSKKEIEEAFAELVNLAAQRVMKN